MKIEVAGTSGFDTDWKGEFNGATSYIIVDGTVTVNFERYCEASPGEWVRDQRDPYIVTWNSGEYNLQTLMYPDGERDLNDTAQQVTVHAGSVKLHEHDPDDSQFPGAIITLTCNP